MIVSIVNPSRNRRRLGEDVLGREIVIRNWKKSISRMGSRAKVISRFVEQISVA